MLGVCAHTSAFPHRGQFIRADMCICANYPVRHAIFVVIGKRSVCKAVLSQRKGRASGCAMQLVERGRNSDGHRYAGKYKYTGRRAANTAATGKGTAHQTRTWGMARKRPKKQQLRR